MTTQPQFEQHLDADQLTAFAEGALSTPERTLCLRHLAECAHCREVAFLAGLAVPSENPAPASARRFAGSWWSILSLGAAALAAAVITAILWHNPHKPTSQESVQIASQPSTVTPPASTTANSITQPATEPSKTPSPARPARTRKEALKREASLDADQQLKDAATLEPPAPPAKPAAAVQPQSALGGKNLPADINIAAAPPLGSASSGRVAATAKAARAYSEPLLNALAGSSQIAGTITDSAGAAIPHAKITLSQDSGTASRDTFTDAAGRFTIPSLQPGKYRLEISSLGFMTQVREVDLGANQIAGLDSKLAVGSVSETVAVQAAPALETESESLKSIVPNQNPLQTTVSSGARSLALDTSGKLFLAKKPGSHWKAIHGPWKKSALTSLSLTLDMQFKVTTAESSWLSSDGEHWHTAN